MAVHLMLLHVGVSVDHSGIPVSTETGLCTGDTNRGVNVRDCANTHKFVGKPVGEVFGAVVDTAVDAMQGVERGKNELILEHDRGGINIVDNGE